MKEINEQINSGRAKESVTIWVLAIEVHVAMQS